MIIGRRMKGRTTADTNQVFLSISFCLSPSLYFYFSLSYTQHTHTLIGCFLFHSYRLSTHSFNVLNLVESGKRLSSLSASEAAATRNKKVY